ncbi:MAG: ATP-dependent dethiobiotin synthetase BioD [Oscillatoriales cyanobacterium SM2_2_1]|nr:ATP-dependent dethiobiotin synthetase BioD [Oscillatoriales cyanobacterium SM2_2_1]
MITDSRSLLVAGTDTGVGKTIATLALAATWWQRRGPCGLYKPVQCGPGDREQYLNTLPLDQTLDDITPFYFTAPLAPPLAAALEGRVVDLGILWQQYQRLQERFAMVFVEAAGGLGTPVTAEYTFADLARDWHLPTVLVVPVRLGAIAQAVATVAYARSQKIAVKGIILNAATEEAYQRQEEWAPTDILARLTYTSILGTIPPLQTLDREALRQAGEQLDWLP